MRIHYKYLIIVILNLCFYLCSCNDNASSNATSSADSANKTASNVIAEQVIYDSAEKAIPNFGNITPKQLFNQNVLPRNNASRVISKIEIKKTSFSTLRRETLKRAKKDWKAIYNACRIGSDDYNINEFDFLGVGNPKGLGQLIDSSNLLSRTPMDSTIFTAEELQRIISVGNIVRCKSATSKSMALSTLFDGSLKCDTLDSNLTGIVENSLSQKKTIIFNIGGWQKVELNTEWLLHYLDSGSKRNNIQMYRNAFHKPSTLIIAKAIYVKGFSVDIGLNKALSLDIQNKLKAPKEIKFGDIIFKLTLKSNSDKTITLTSDSDFIVFGYSPSTKSLQ